MSLLKEARDAILGLKKVRDEFTEEQQAVAKWLRGQRQMAESLEDLLRARIEARGLLPVPSTPTEAHLDRARDAECRAIIAWLRMIERSPVPSPFESDGSTE